MNKLVFTVIALSAVFYCAGIEFGRTPRIVSVVDNPDPAKGEVSPDGLQQLQESPFLTVIEGDTVKVADENAQLKTELAQHKEQIKALRAEIAQLKAAADDAGAKKTKSA